MRFCSRCGASISASDRFCGKCGQALAPSVPGQSAPVVAAPMPRQEPAPTVAPPPVAPAPSTDRSTPYAYTPAPAPIAPAAPATVAPRKSGAMWFIVPILLIIVALAAWMILSGFPREEKRTAREERAVEVVREEERPAAPAQRDAAGEIVEVEAPVIRESTGGADQMVDIGASNDSGGAVGTRVPEPLPAADSPVRTDPNATPAPKPAESRPTRSSSEMDALTAQRRLASFISESGYYGSDSSCVSVSSRGYANRGYTLEARASGCAGQPDRVERWRVDSLTGEIFRQRADGRFLRP